MNEKKYTTSLMFRLSIFGDLFDPQEFSRFIRISPTAFWHINDVIPPIQGLKTKPNTPELRRKESSWNHSTEYIETLDFQELSESFVEKFESKIEAIKKYIGK